MAVDVDQETCTAMNDPPPPYPSRERRRQARSERRRSQRLQAPSQHMQLSSADSRSDHDSQTSPLTAVQHTEDEEEDATENTPFLSPSPRGTIIRRLPSGRPRSLSHASTVSAAPSLAQTILSLFRTDDEMDDFSDFSDERELLSPSFHGRREDGVGLEGGRQHQHGLCSSMTWSRYFRPLTQKVYYRALFHLFVLNFPYALAAWIYLFVFTLTGTTLLMALPLGAVLCFFDLLGARAFARGELALQTTFHSPLSYPAPYPPRPIFTRLREASTADIEAGRANSAGLVLEASFYKNAYAMFTDPTSYQALFYFLVIKPSITLIFSLALLILVIPSLILVFPAPAALRAVRRLGLWQANVAVEGLYLAVR